MVRPKKNWPRIQNKHHLKPINPYFIFQGCQKLYIRVPISLADIKVEFVACWWMIGIWSPNNAMVPESFGNLVSLLYISKLSSDRLCGSFTTFNSPAMASSPRRSRWPTCRCRPPRADWRRRCEPKRSRRRGAARLPPASILSSPLSCPLRLSFRNGRCAARRADSTLSPSPSRDECGASWLSVQRWPGVKNED